jgi:uncharacterized protein DUF3175
VPRRKSTRSRYWSGEVTKHSNALDLDKSVFTWRDPHKVARSLRNSAERSARKKGSSFQSAMSMLNFYINRAGRHLSGAQKSVLTRAKLELRKLYGKGKVRHGGVSSKTSWASSTHQRARGSHQ